MRSFLMNEIVDRGLTDVVDEAVAYSLEGGAKGVFISVDIDVVDPGLAPGTGTPEPGGLGSRELLDTVRRLSRDLNVLGADIVEVSPPYDGPGEQTVLSGQSRRARDPERDGGAQARGRVVDLPGQVGPIRL